jgi:hypothetical protein
VPNSEALSSSERKIVPVLPMAREYRFYYRLQNEVIYIPVESVLGYLGERLYRDQELVEKVRLELPLRRNTDLFAPFLDDRFAWKTLSFVLAEVLQSGEASVWNLEKGLVNEIEVERYVERCTAGRRFRYAGGGVFFAVEDSVA